MKLETTKTMTLYISLPVTEYETILGSDCLAIPSTSEAVVLRSAPYPEPTYLGPTVSSHDSSSPALAQLVLRAQVRADYARELHFETAGEEGQELHMGPDRLPDLNRNLVGPVSVAVAPPSSGWRVPNATDHLRPVAMAVPVAH